MCRTFAGRQSVLAKEDGLVISERKGNFMLFLLSSLEVVLNALSREGLALDDNRVSCFRRLINSSAHYALLRFVCFMFDLALVHSAYLGF